ncbi:MAG: septum formation initiator family protein [Gammaproteobacteria bacterium]|jgi:cell division protein FtsB|nr:septum formation initiator family protein [Gammaproteobacteria bacterium]
MKLKSLVLAKYLEQLAPKLIRITDARYWQNMSRFDMFLWIMGVLIFLLQFSLWLGPSSVTSLLILDYKIYRLEQVNQKDTQHNMQLYQRIQGLKQGNDEVEARARVELGMVKQGETFYQLVNQAILKADGSS